MLKMFKGKAVAKPRVSISKETRAMGYRWLASGLLWVLLLGSFIFSIRSVSLTSEAVEYIQGKALTPKMAEDKRVAGEIARGYAIEWGTFDGKDKEDYQNRLSVYLGDGKPAPPPNSLQKCISASVVSTEPVAGTEGIFRSKILMHISRLTKLPENKTYNISEERKAPGPKIENPNSPWEPWVSVWQDSILQTEVSVKITRDGPQVIGLPVPIPVGKAIGVAANEYLDREEVPKDFTVFLQQAMAMYFEGNNMANFVEPGSSIKPLGGFTTGNIAVTGFENMGEGAVKATINGVITGDNIEEMPISLVVEAVNKDGQGQWLLTRIGSW